MWGVLKKPPTGPGVAHCATLAKCLPDKLLWLAACSENSTKKDPGVEERAILSCYLACAVLDCSMGMKSGFYCLPWTLGSYSSPPVSHVLLESFYSCSTVLDHCGIISSSFPEHNITPGCQFLCRSSAGAQGHFSPNGNERGVQTSYRPPSLHTWCSKCRSFLVAVFPSLNNKWYIFKKRAAGCQTEGLPGAGNENKPFSLFLFVVVLPAKNVYFSWNRLTAH